MLLQEADPKGLVRESYRIEGITPGDCRIIFMEWALSVPLNASSSDALRTLIAHYAPANPGHPMNAVLEAGLGAPPDPRRRGGRLGRQGSDGEGAPA